MKRCVIGLLVALSASLVSAQEWTRFHGPNGSGALDTVSLPAKWSQKDYLFTTHLPGIGHSSPVIWKDKVFLLSADPDTAKRYVLCIHATKGDILWKKEFDSETHHLHTRSSYASSTPAVDKDHVYVAWSTPNKTTLKAFSHQGKEIWSKDLGRWLSQHGFGNSPMLYKDMVILCNSQQGNKLRDGVKPGKSRVMAFSRSNGEVRWETPRKSNSTSYSVPCIYTDKNGVDQLICCNSQEGMMSLDPNTGKENWLLPAFDKRSVSSPTILGGLVFGSTGSGGGGNYVVAVDPSLKDPKIVYKITRHAPYVPSVVGRGDMAFLWFDKGMLTCINAKTGEVHFDKKRLGAPFSGSPVRAGDKMYCIDEDGTVHVIAATKEFKPLAKIPLGEPSRSTPAISGGRLYLRTYSHLFCIGPKEL